jgi:hypothetical protein
VHRAGNARQDVNNERLDARRKTDLVGLPPGGLVMTKEPMRNSKLDPVWVGPFMIVRQNPRSKTYVLRDLFDNKVLHRNFARSQLKFVADTRVQLSAADGSVIDDAERGVVDVVVRHEEVDGVTWFLVRWKGDASESWLVEKDFDDPSCLTTYFRDVNPGKTRSSKAAAKRNKKRSSNAVAKPSKSSKTAAKRRKKRG